MSLTLGTISSTQLTHHIRASLTRTLALSDTNIIPRQGMPTFADFDRCMRICQRRSLSLTSQRTEPTVSRHVASTAQQFNVLQDIVARIPILVMKVIARIATVSTWTTAQLSKPGASTCTTCIPLEIRSLNPVWILGSTLDA